MPNAMIWKICWEPLQRGVKIAEWAYYLIFDVACAAEWTNDTKIDIKFYNQACCFAVMRSSRDYCVSNKISVALRAFFHNGGTTRKI